MAAKAKKVAAETTTVHPAAAKGPQKPRGRVVKGRPSRGTGASMFQGVTVPSSSKHTVSLDPIADDFVDIHRIAAKQPHLGLPALATALEAAFRRMVARLGKK